MVLDKQQSAQKIARLHRDSEPGIIHVYRLISANENDPREPLKLLEVNRDTIPAGVSPLLFPPHPSSGLQYPLVIIDVTPDEFEQIKRHDLSLPEDWEVAEEIQS